MKSVRKGDVVIYEHDNSKTSTGIVLSTSKKEVTSNKNKYVMEIVIAHMAEVMWDSGIIENDIPVKNLKLVSRAK